ncbi:hypothetical protein QUF64_10390 [Anaerolineales bacterium HSG6]|nr:hypothetical protein [Anaerolineales bacterium HSG6]
MTGLSEFDELTIAAGRESEPAKRAELYAKAEQILAVDEAAYIPIYHYTTYVLSKPWLARTYRGDDILDFANWWIDVAARNETIGD